MRSEGSPFSASKGLDVVGSDLKLFITIASQ